MGEIERTGIAAAMYRRRRELGLSQEQLCERAGLYSRSWQRWESGAVTPTPRCLRQIADALGVDVGYLDAEPDILVRLERKLDLILERLGEPVPSP